MSGKHHILRWILNQPWKRNNIYYPYSNIIEDVFPAKEKRDKMSLIVVLLLFLSNGYDNNQSNIIHTLDSHHHHLVL